MKAGTPAHRNLFCRTFIETHVAFEPETLPWPALAGVELARLQTFPLWSYARAIEQRAGRMVTAFARTLDDALIREAVALQGVEETRHGRLLQHVLDRYEIVVPVLPVRDSPATVDDFRIFGFGECTDSFIGFGAFALVRQKQLFPETLMAIFENILWEEARHIVFFVNWWRYEEARAGRDALPLRTADALRYYARSVAGTAGDAAEAPGLDGATLRRLAGDVTPMQFLEAALAENRRHMRRMDPRLAQPLLIPTLARVALTALRALPPRAA